MTGQQITTAAELDALPVGSVVLDCTGWAWQRATQGGRWRGDHGLTSRPDGLGPFRVIFRPDVPMSESSGQDDDPIPRYAQLDVWMALFGADRSQEYEAFRDEHGFAETWALLCHDVRAQAARAGEAVDREALLRVVRTGVSLWENDGDVRGRPEEVWEAIRREAAFITDVILEKLPALAARADTGPTLATETAHAAVCDAYEAGRGNSAATVSAEQLTVAVAAMREHHLALIPGDADGHSGCVCGDWDDSWDQPDSWDEHLLRVGLAALGIEVTQ